MALIQRYPKKLFAKAMDITYLTNILFFYSLTSFY